MRLSRMPSSTLVVLVVSVSAQPAVGQEISRGLSIGRSQVDSPFERHFHDGVTGAGKRDMGWHFQGWLQWAPQRLPFGLRAEALYNRLTTPGSMSPSYARSDQVFGVGGAVMWPRPRSDEGFEAYLIGGGSLFANRLGTVTAFGVTDVSQTRWSWGPAWNAGVGFAADLLGVRTGLEIRMHQATFTGRGSGWIGFSVPVLW